MANSVNDIAKQARQGSVAAIIQLLNEILADSGVRTRAVLSDGMLQLLCEAPETNQLEQSRLVTRVKHILESISPRSIKRVNINTRIVREQQLLWLDEIKRDPEGQLLWSEEITLKRPNFFKQVLEDWKVNRIQAASSKQSLPQLSGSGKKPGSKQFWLGLFGGAGLLLLLLVGGGLLFNWLKVQWKIGEPELGSSNENYQAAADGKLSEASPPESTPAEPATEVDPFVGAVRLAEEATLAGKTAETPAEWLDLAAKWQKASDFMAAVPSSDARYKTAQDRITLYSNNSQYAQQEADRVRSRNAAATQAQPAQN